LEVELALIHQDLEGAELILAEIHRWLGHVLIDSGREQTHISHGVYSDTVHKASFLGSANIKLKIV
jgi:hypothetical protein